MKFHSGMAVGLVLLASARAALAADSDAPTNVVNAAEQETLVPRVGFNIGGGVSLPISNAEGRFQTGGGFQLGVTYNFTQSLGVQAEYFHSSYGIRSDVLSSNGVDGNHSMQYGDLNVVYRVLPSRPFGVYVLGGPGIYHRRVQITQFAGTAVVPYCDPWLFFCYNSPVAVDQVLGSRSRTDFGLNAGVGLGLRLFGGPILVYVEGRYHYVFSGTIDTPAGPRKADGQYLPIMFGFRL